MEKHSNHTLQIIDHCYSFHCVIEPINVLNYIILPSFIKVNPFFLTTQYELKYAFI